MNRLRVNIGTHLTAILASMAGGALAGGAIVLMVTSVPQHTTVSQVADVASPSPSSDPTPSVDPTPVDSPTPEPSPSPTSTTAPAPAPVPAPVPAPKPSTAPAPAPSPVPPPVPPAPSFKGVTVTPGGPAPLAVTWHLDVTGTGPFTVQWTINGQEFTSDGVDLQQTLPVGTYSLTALRITDANGQAAVVVFVTAPKVVAW